MQVESAGYGLAGLVRYGNTDPSRCALKSGKTCTFFTDTGSRARSEISPTMPFQIVWVISL